MYLRFPAPFAILLVTAIIGWATCAGALEATTEGGQGRAASMFRRGRELLDLGRFSEACQAFRESQELRASPAALGNIAGCLEAEGDLAGALRTFEAARDLARRDPRPSRRASWTHAATQAIERLEKRVARVFLTPPPTPGSFVLLDGSPVPAQPSGSPTPIWANPGERVLVIRTQGKPPQSVRLVLTAGESRSVGLQERETHNGPLSLASPRPVRDERSEVEDTVAMGMNGAELLAAMGGASAAAGTIFGLLAWRAESTMQRRCPSSQSSCMTVDATDLERTKLLAHTATALWAAGLLGAGVGVTLMLLDDDSEAETERRGVTAQCGGAGCSLELTTHF